MFRKLSFTAGIHLPATETFSSPAAVLRPVASQIRVVTIPETLMSKWEEKWV